MRRRWALYLCLNLASFAPGCSCDETLVIDEDAAASAWKEAVTCPPTGNPRVLTTNSGDDTVTFIDLVDLSVCSAPVGHLPPELEGPHHGAAFADGSAFFIGLSNYVPGSGSGPHGSHGSGDVKGYLLKYDTDSLELAEDVLVDRSPGDVRLTPDEKYVLQSHFDLLRIMEYLNPTGDAAPASPNSVLAVIDPQTLARLAMIEMCPAAHGIGLAGDSLTAYVSCYGSDQVAAVGLAPPWDQVDLFPVGSLMVPLGSNPAYGPYAVAVEEPAAGPRRLWVSNTTSMDVRVFDATTHEMVTPPIVLPSSPFFGDFWRGFFVVPAYGTATLHFIDTTTFAVTTMQLPQPTMADGSDGCISPHVALTVDDRRILVACEGNHGTDPGTVLDIDPEPRATSRVIPVGVFPDDLVLISP